MPRPLPLPRIERVCTPACEGGSDKNHSAFQNAIVCPRRQTELRDGVLHLFLTLGIELAKTAQRPWRHLRVAVKAEGRQPPELFLPRRQNPPANARRILPGLLPGPALCISTRIPECAGRSGLAVALRFLPGSAGSTEACSRGENSGPIWAIWGSGAAGPTSGLKRIHPSILGSAPSCELDHTREFSDANPYDYLTRLLRHRNELKRAPQHWMPWNYRQAIDPGAPSTGPPA